MFSVPTLGKTKSAGVKIAARKVQMRLLRKFPKAKTGKYWDRLCEQTVHSWDYVTY